MSAARATQTQTGQKATPAARPRPAPVRAAPPPARTSKSFMQTAAPAVRLGSASTAPKAASLPGTSGGAPLSPKVESTLENSFQVNLQGVRVHTDTSAQQAAASLSARAFTYGNHIFLGPGERATDIGLLAHETAHVVQQQGEPAVQRSAPGQSNTYEREADRASAAVLRGERFAVRERTSRAGVQRLGISDALNFFADAANLIPGFRLLTIILGVNPINMQSVARSAANILRAIVEFIPGGGLITRALDTYGIFDRVGGWIEQQITALGVTGGALRQALNRFLDSLSWRDIFDLGGVWNRARAIFDEPAGRFISFAKGLLPAILGFLREAVLRPLARLAEGTQGYDLLKAVLGQDPVTGDPVERNAETLIGGFMKLIGQEEVWNNLKRANAVARAWAWFQGALGGLMGYVRQIPSLIVSTLQSIVLEDLLPITNLFAKVGRAFGGFIGSFLSWAGGQVMSLLEIIFDVVAPSVMPYIRRAAGAFRSIIQNPIGFVGNLVRAGIQGFRQFAGNFLNHLRASLIGWLTGTLSGAGVYIPQAFNLREIIKFVLSVLGLTWQNLRQRLVRAVGEPAVSALETGFDIVVTLVREGPAAAWEKIREAISNLRDMVMGQIMTFVRERVVQAAITRLLTSLNPAGAFIQAIIAIYNTVMFFVERLRQIAQVAMSFIDSIAAIAAGGIGTAANRVEQTMAGLLTLVVSFLARIAGLGRVSDAVVRIINNIRAPIFRAMDRVVDWIVTQVRRLGSAIFRGARSAAGRLLEWWKARKTFAAADRSSHSLYFQGQGASAVLTVASTPAPVRAFLSSIRSAATSSADATVRASIATADSLSTQIDAIRARVETGPTPRMPAEIDLLNSKMEQLANVLPPLVSLAYPAPAGAAGAAPVAVNELVKVKAGNAIGVVTEIAPPLVKIKYIRPRSPLSGAVGFSFSLFGKDFFKHVDDPRELYLGPTPKKSDPVGAQVKARMQREGKFRIQNGVEQILYSRDGKWWNVGSCDMGHVIDAVMWWNSNGRLTGAQSAEALRFMNDPINYEFEPSGPNRSRGAALAARGVRYLPPVK